MSTRNTTKYDYRAEVDQHHRRAGSLRSEAALIRSKAEERARALDHEAARADAVAAHVQRLCTR